MDSFLKTHLNFDDLPMPSAKQTTNKKTREELEAIFGDYFSSCIFINLTKSENKLIYLMQATLLEEKADALVLCHNRHLFDWQHFLQRHACRAACGVA